MAVTPAPTSANQTNYLNGLVKAGGGNGEWAKTQLSAAPQTPKPILGGLSQAQLTGMGEAIKGLGTNFGAGAQQTPAPQGTFNPPESAGADTNYSTDTNVVPAPTVPAPPVGGIAKTDYSAIAASRIAAQRAALAGSVTAYDASRKSAYDYSQQTTKGNRALLQFDNSNRGDQFGGSAREDLFRLQRSQGLEDTAANTQYQNDISASDAKLAAFDAGSAGQQQDIMDQLQQRDFTNNISQAGVTGQYGGNPTLAAQGQQFNQGVATAGLTGQYNGAPTMAAQNQQFNQTQQVNAVAYQHARDAITDKQYQAKFDQDVKQQGFENALKIAVENHQISQDAAQLAISQQNTNISQQNANTSSSNANWSKDPNNPDNLYKQSEIAKNNAVVQKPVVVDPKVSVDNSQYYKSQIDASKGLTKDQMLSYAQNNAANMTDADYKALINYINTKY